MGKDIAEHCPAAADLFEKPTRLSAMTCVICVLRAEEALNTTTVSQPAFSL